MKIFKILFLLLTCNIALYGIPKAPCDAKYDVCCQESNDNFAFSYTNDLGLACPRDFYIFGEALLMQPYEEGLEFTISNAGGFMFFPLIDPKIEGFTTGSHTKDWDLGFRFGIGFYLEHDNWNLDVQWTHLHSNIDKSVSVTGSTILLPLWFAPTLGFCQQASARWKTDLNTLDLSLGKPFHISRYFIANPYFGIRGAWIDQNYKARYGGTFDKASMTAKNNFWGLGTKTGFDGDFLLGSHIKIFGKVATSLLWSKFNVDQSTEPDDVINIAFDLNNEFYSTATNAEMALGIAWGTLFDKDQYHIDLRLAYEFHKWFEQNRLRRFLNSSIVTNTERSKSDLIFEGFSLRVQFDF